MDEFYRNKYLKYKDKYITLKKIDGGAVNTTELLVNIILNMLSKPMVGISDVMTKKIEKYKQKLQEKYTENKEDKDKIMYTFMLFEMKIYDNTAKRILEYTTLQNFYELFKKYVFENNNQIYNLNEKKIKEYKKDIQEEAEAAIEIAKLKHFKQEKLKKMRNVLKCKIDNVEILDCEIDKLDITDNNKCICKE
jgi:hypothetical protein